MCLGALGHFWCGKCFLQLYSSSYLHLDPRNVVAPPGHTSSPSLTYNLFFCPLISQFTVEDGLKSFSLLWYNGRQWKIVIMLMDGGNLCQEAIVLIINVTIRVPRKGPSHISKREEYLSHSAACSCGLVDIFHVLLYGVTKEMFALSLSYLYFPQIVII